MGRRYHFIILHVPILQGISFTNSTLAQKEHMCYTFSEGKFYDILGKPKTIILKNTNFPHKKSLIVK